MPQTDRERLAGPSRPLGAPDIPQFHLPTSAGSGVFSPRLYGAARIHFADGRRKFDETRHVAFIVPIDPSTTLIDWDTARPTDLTPDDLLIDPPLKAPYLPLPAGAMDHKVFTRWAKNFDRWLARTQRLTLPGKADSAEDVAIRPKRGGVAVELVGIAWELT